MENRLGLATKRFCMVNADNSKIREEIHRLLVERKDFNVLWNRTIGKLLRGKEYLMDILEIATKVFGERDEYCKKLEAVKWRGLFQLNKDIAEMQSYEYDLNHLAKLEEYLRTKGTVRHCEADEKREIKMQEEIVRCEQEIAKHDRLLEEIFEYAGTAEVGVIITDFDKTETENFSLFILLCAVLQESVFLSRDLEHNMRQAILDRHDFNQAAEERRQRRIAEFTKELNEQQRRTEIIRNQYQASENMFNKVLRGIDDLIRLSRCDITPLYALLGNHREVTQWNVSKFLKNLEYELKSLIEVAYGAVKPPPPTPKGRPADAVQKPKLVADPHVEKIRPNRIEKLVPYQPCAYCVEDYIMNQVFETPAVAADEAYIDSIFHLENINTRFEIYTLTIPAKIHPFRGKKDN